MKMKWGFTAILLILIGIVSSGCLENSCSSQKEEQNIALIRHIHSEIAKGNFDVFDTTLTSDYVRHCQAMPPEFQEIHGSADLKNFVKEFINGVSDYSETFDFIMAKGDTVAYITTMTATQTGTMNGIPPTGKTFECVNIIIQRFEEGKIAETWISWDNLAILSQLGLFPPSPPDKQ